MEINKFRKKVFVGLSGGVDSAVSAALLKEQGFEVTGVYMKNWSGDDYGIQSECPWEADQKDAEAICKHLGIEFRSFNFEKEYREKVVEYFFSEYAKGRTPNPDVMCNKEIKFKLFLERSLEEGADYIATGHYARNIDNKLFKGVDKNKDQTYFLYNLTYEQLSHTLFPIGHLTKPQVREIARQYKLPNADKPDSQGICFIGEINVLKFLMSRIPEKKGEIRDIDTNKVVGEHKGVYFYTVGQRDGLGIGGLKEPYFVVDKDIDGNVLYVGMGTNKALYRNVVNLEKLHLINPDEDIPTKLQASVRYRHKPEEGTLNGLEFSFNNPQRAVTSGQSLVIYSEEQCLGGGIIF
jgi:tRNA-specific 2-thiouridylase